MTAIPTGILKKNQVRLSTAGRAEGHAAPASPTAAAEVRIVEQHPDYALVEVRCACGRCTYVQCRYPAGPAPAAAKS